MYNCVKIPHYIFFVCYSLCCSCGVTTIIANPQKYVIIRLLANINLTVTPKYHFIVSFKYLQHIQRVIYTQEWPCQNLYCILKAGYI